MSERAYPGEVIRAAEVPLLGAGAPLMERAATALALYSAAALRARGRAARDRRVAGSRVCVLAGPGNNAGDALFAAASLARGGAQVSIVLLFDRTHDEGLRAARRAGARAIDLAAVPAADALETLRRADLVLDGILGTGGRRGLPAHITGLIRDWRRGGPTPGTVIAVDVPSDLDPADPETAGERIHADHTVTFGGLKAELIDPRVRRFTGRVHVVDIGLDLDAARAAAEVMVGPDLAADFPRPRADDHKYSRGVLGVVAGSATYPGAGVLTTTSAVGSGIGMVRYLGAASVADRVLTHHPEVVTAEGAVDALVMGSGDPEDEFVAPALEAIADTDVPLVLDAGSLALVGDDAAALTGRPVVLTPHAGELARLLSRLLGEDVSASRITADPLGWARRAASRTGHIVLLKGGSTVIACPDGYAVLPESGPPSLATAGSGDVLSGIIGSLLAGAHARATRRGAEPGESLDDRTIARTLGLAVLVHNAAGSRCVNAGQLATAVGDVVEGLLHPDPSASDSPR
ncbi:hydroxyethylthiazole kinase-like uncharacterized protein yjeF/hydroxyethylthiazole kinase-like uncharacterized protein yjeF [Brevibacterium sanguinis]|uniref:Bifunctional NAD(P)H-hydrate repair enzyme n=2 Tax=Brevibacterium TaxID=1696 RepID=A0A366IPY2_9MICO|nr:MULTISPECIES: NAD(P)H-hydrate dehydratase [Brevibacterium]RBP68172.1 hydroxyethylthiazole kinase-like uncharacterized protein yjeF/hydroxyethylthiazole kinase-like uncharacterized protein yjeF [Brevibacterium sanguinis]RBP74411.1 hydroxyethylthiazole kinase-like uncharacterized protein yjeF/hydroxyethylthiazole kinase-like uncharacterized protein yjeF [Brevibacterium celere]